MTTETIINPIYDSNQEPVRKDNTILCQVIENGNEKIMYIDESFFTNSSGNNMPIECGNESGASVTESCTSRNENKLEWAENDTKLLLDLYHEGLPQVGPLKKLRNKKALWQYISNEIERQLQILRTATQCESRYKTVLRRKSTSTKVNKTSGEIREEIEFESEIEKIKSQDDSLEPEILMSGNNLKVNVKRSASPSTSQRNDIITSKRTRSDHLVTFLKDIHNEREENRERRHKEKLQLMKELFKNESS